MILNLTQHKTTEEQFNQGVAEPGIGDKAAIQKLLTFNEIPTGEEIIERASKLARIASTCGADKAMIGGAGFLMSALEEALRAEGIQPLHAFSVRKSIEEEVEGKIEKKSIFVHLGFVEVTPKT